MIKRHFSALLRAGTLEIDKADAELHRRGSSSARHKPQAERAGLLPHRHLKTHAKSQPFAGEITVARLV
jgi:hypothetical protein